MSSIVATNIATFNSDNISEIHNYNYGQEAVSFNLFGRPWIRTERCDDPKCKNPELYAVLRKIMNLYEDMQLIVRFKYCDNIIINPIEIIANNNIYELTREVFKEDFTVKSISWILRVNKDEPYKFSDISSIRLYFEMINYEKKNGFCSDL